MEDILAASTLALALTFLQVAKYNWFKNLIIVLSGVCHTHFNSKIVDIIPNCTSANKEQCLLPVFPC